MRFIVAPECHAFGLRAGAVVFRGVRVTETGPALREQIAQAVAAARARFADLPAVRATPEVTAFRAALRAAGADPNRDRPSVERLLGLALKRGALPAVNTLVEAYNLVSLRTLCSLGAHDLDTLTPPVALRLLAGAETFTPLSGAEAEPVTPGEYGYVDGAGRVLCRLDVRQAEFSKVTAETVNALLIVEATAAHPDEAVRQAFADAVELITRHCGGTAEVLALPAGLTRGTCN
jgi:DNA/RNA-binding domain of Phe-tRNA-synthetase-like protein